MAANGNPATTVPAVPGVPAVPAIPIGGCVPAIPGRPGSVPPWHTIIVLPRRHG
ncbi:MAG TPA: hypothetical protein VGD48_26375 [Kutzneria sp.]|jgi:hypothetical protein